MPARKWVVQEFNGKRYYRKPTGYYKADYARHGGKYMHQDVWEYYHGAIPEDMCVHHKDHDRSNNAVENLELLSKSEHAKHHMAHRSKNKAGWYKPGLEKAREAAAQWHREFAKTEEGQRKLSEQGRASWESREPEQYACVHCGVAFERLRGTNKRGYCSPACQTAARVASGVDDKTRQCVVCGNDFRVNTLPEN